MADTEFLRLTLRTSLELGVAPVALVHALQNHDELTYELVHWATAHHADIYAFRDAELTGAELAETVRGDLVDKLTGDAADYNLVFTTNGIACTTASLIAATQGHTTLDAITDEHVDDIRNAHLLLAKFNAWQPGVFALSAWDLLGMLPLAADSVHDLIAEGDTRWVHRGAHDLMDVDPDATFSSSRMPRGRSLYGSLPAQLASKTSFASELAEVLRIRSTFEIDVATQVDIPDVAHPSMLVMVHRLDAGVVDSDDARLQVTVLNFGNETIEGTVRSSALIPRSTVTNAATDELVGKVDDLQSFSVQLEPYAGLFLIIDPTEESPDVAPTA